MLSLSGLALAFLPTLLSAQTVGGTGDLILRFAGQHGNDHFGWSVSGAGDVDGDSRPDLIVGAPFAGANGINDVGSAFVFAFNPILTASSEIFSVSAGGTIDYAIDFPDVDAGQKYGILLSARRTGPTLFKGLLIPLKKDKFFLASIKGNTPPQGINFQGTLDPQGQATAHFTAAPGSIPARFVGRSIFLAAVNKKLDFSSVARRIDFVP
ncbi:MAG: integrin alpha [Planctomycetota bacterium]